MDVRSRKVTGVTVVGVRGHLVAVEAHVGRGLPSLTLTGLPVRPVVMLTPPLLRLGPLDSASRELAWTACA
jgi:hypothetical protein